MIRHFAGLLTIALVGAGLVSEARADIPALLACAEQADAKLRLACYDSEAAKLKTQLAEAQARKLSLFGFTLPFGDSDGAKTPSGGAASADVGGSAEKEPILGPHEVNQISAKLSSLSKDAFGHSVVTLDNGQVWKVSDYSHLPNGGGTSQTIHIVRNMFGGFYLNVDDQTNDIPVNRIR
jgi:hypothetical protein